MAAGTLQAWPIAIDITKSDTVNFDGTTYSSTPLAPPKPCEAIWVGTGGIVAVVKQDGQVVNMTAPSGLLPVRAIRVNSTNTTAALMQALYRS